MAFLCAADHKLAHRHRAASFGLTADERPHARARQASPFAEICSMAPLACAAQRSKSLDESNRAMYREIEIEVVCPGGKPRRAFSCAASYCRRERRTIFYLRRFGTKQHCNRIVVYNGRSRAAARRRRNFHAPKLSFGPPFRRRNALRTAATLARAKKRRTNFHLPGFAARKGPESD